jgi:hypothetical protein
MRSEKELFCFAATAKKHPLPNQPERLVAFHSTFSFSVSFYRDFVQTDILDSCPDNGEATRLCGEHVDLIGALAHIAEEALNSVGGLNVSVHGGSG